MLSNARTPTIYRPQVWKGCNTNLVFFLICKLDEFFMTFERFRERTSLIHSYVLQWLIFGQFSKPLFNRLASTRKFLKSGMSRNIPTFNGKLHEFEIPVCAYSIVGKMQQKIIDNLQSGSNQRCSFITEVNYTLKLQFEKNFLIANGKRIYITTYWIIITSILRKSKFDRFTI